MGKKRKTQRIDREMAFDDERFWDRLSAPKLSPIGAFVKAKPFGLNTGVAGILHGLGINYQ